jgi:predicted CXXCH cytochrome family protein
MQNVELLLFLLTAGVTSGVLILAGRPAGRLNWILLVVPVFCLGAAVLWIPPDTQLQLLRQEVPAEGRADFAGSEACRSCHVSHYESWHASYHRTMTQLASEESVLAPFDGRVLESHGIRCQVHRVDDWFVVDMADPDWEAMQYPNGIGKGQVTGAPQVRLPVVMTTGSHHLQAYWVPSTHGNKLRIFPWVYHIGLQRWLPNEDSFIAPPDMKHYPQIWNNTCIRCHSVNGDVGYEPGNWRSSVAELGISCEACHGPGEQHVLRHRSPLTRYRQHLGDAADPTIVNPARLPPKEASQICGQCHTAFGEELQPSGTYRAGDDFHAAFSLADSRAPDDARFWSDGSVRVGGREFSGLSESACFTQGELSCLSCHSMHSSDPNKQMQPSKLSNDACTQCHSELANDLSQHTHHAADSAGSQCYNCHMPHTSYALFSAIRSHRIDSPRVASTSDGGRPNACNQCHVDRTLSWTAEHLQQWFGTESIDLNADERMISASLLWLLRGDAVQRVLAAWSLGWDSARQASGEGWQAPLLVELLDDPYAMVRFMASQSLQKLGIELGDYDFLVYPDQRSPVAPTILRSLKQSPEVDTLADGVRSLFDSDGRLNRELVERLLRQRDTRPITLNE